MGVLVLLTFGGGWGGGVVRNREFPDFRSPEVGRYETVLSLLFSQSVLKGAKYRQRLHKINCVFFASFPSPIWFFASLQTFPLTVHAHRLYQVPK